MIYDEIINMGWDGKINYSFDNVFKCADGLLDVIFCLQTFGKAHDK